MERSGRVIRGPGVFQIIGKLFNGRMSGAGTAIGDDNPGCDAYEERSDNGGDAFEVIHTKV
jgi:hypothetical protein